MSNCVLDSLLVVIMISDDLCERSTNECINKFCTKFYNVGKKNSMSVLEEYYNKLLKPEMQLVFRGCGLAPAHAPVVACDARRP